jgi:2-dehydro-3-deoxyphosphogluconate aldolase/(4S)-4-hydroxy-2-oxoglutarate aldolase
MNIDIDKESTLSRVREVGLLAVIRGPSPQLTLQMVEALVAGGVTGIEITYSTPNAAEVVKTLDERYGESILLGMGTLTEVRQVAEARQAGAQFIVSPHLDETLAQAMVSTGLLTMIGALTPTEVVRAHHLGSDVVKLFPGSLGGPAYLKALRGPFPHIPMMPTGGVSQENIGEWLAAGAVAVGAGSNLCPTALAKEGRFNEITSIARTFVTALNRARSS